MSEPIGIQIGTQSIGAGDNIVPKTPQDFANEHPFLANSNLLFDNTMKWTVASNDAYDGTTLMEGSPYEYGENIDVQANWRKKVQVSIFCNGCHYQAGSDLAPYVSVNGGTSNGMGVTGEYINIYSFFKDNGSPVLRVSNSTIIVNGNTYTFIGWASEAIDPPYVSAETPIWLGYTTEYRVPSPIAFDSNYLNETWAVFLYGSSMQLIVKTNIPEFNTGNFQYNYTMGTHTTVQRTFSTNPTTISNEFFGSHFVCEPCLTTYSGYAFDGWFMGEGAAETRITDASTTVTPFIYAITSRIVLTAKYVVSGSTYTITYHSGLS